MVTNFRWTVLAAAFALIAAASARAQGALLVPYSGGVPADAGPAYASRLQDLAQARTTAAMALFRADLDVLNGAEITIPLPGGSSVVAVRSSRVERGPADFSWIGEINGAPGSVVLVAREGQVTGSVQNGLDLYSVIPLGGGVHAVVKVDRTKLPPEHPELLHAPPDNRTDAAPAQPAANATVDVLVAYTPGAATLLADPVAAAQAQVDQTNQHYIRSQIAITMRLVGTMSVPYTETSANGKDPFTNALTDMRNGVGPFSAVFTKRDQVGADLVVLLIKDTTYCGLAYVNSSASFAFGTVGADSGCLSGAISFAHEIGHNFGAVHDPVTEAQQGNSPPPYSYGYGYFNPGKTWHTIMAYGSACNCPAIGYFSNPNVSFQNEPTGNTTQFNVARVHNERAATVAAFRPAAETVPNLVSSVLPSSRSVQVPTPATAFATVINAGGGAATNCGLALGTNFQGNASLSYQTTNPATNQVTGTANTPVPIAAGSSQSFVFSITPSAAIAPTDTRINTTCTNAATPGTISGVNTILLSASTSPVSDIVALAASTDPGYVNLPGATGAGAFSVATVNVGANASIIVQADTGATALPVSISLCQTNSSGTCINPAFPGGSSVGLTINHNETPTFSVFVTGAGTVANNAATNRVFVRFKDSGGNTRGSTSVAVRTQ